jgi:hypothetical protein
MADDIQETGYVFRYQVAVDNAKLRVFLFELSQQTAKDISFR